MRNKLSDAIKLANKSALMLGSVAAVTMMGFATTANAQDAGAEPEEVLVTGIRGALQQAIDVKRNSDAVVDAISSEDIGKFPDKNLAESLQRVPGVTINRGFTGEGNEVSIRGVNPQLTSVLLNGNYVASTGWFSQTANKRSFNMDLLPSELVKKVEVYKSPTASLDEGGVGGTVIVETRKPLDLDANTAFVSLEGMANSIADGETGGGATGMYSWKNESESFGILVAASTLETIGRAHKAENYWEEGWSASGIAAFDQDRVRDVFDITAQWAPTDELTFTGHYLSTEIDATNTNQNFLFINSHWRDGVQNQNMIVPGTKGGRTTPNNGLATIGEYTSGAWLAQDINSREANIKSEVGDVGFKYEIDGFTLEGSVGTTEANGGNGGNINSLWGIGGYAIDWAAPGEPGKSVPFMYNGKPVTVKINMDGKTQMQLAPQGVDAADGEWQALGDGPSRESNVLHDEEQYFELDGKFDVEFGAVNAIKTGIKARTHEFSNDGYRYTYTGTEFAGTTLADWQDGVIKHSGEGLFGGSPTRIARIDADKVRKAFKANQSAGVQNRGAWAEVEEDITALYTQADFEGDAYAGNVGVRYVTTDITGTRYTIAALNDVNNKTTEQEKGEYSDILPSFNYKLDLSDDLVARFSAARVMSRPGYSDMSPSYTSQSQVSRKAAKGNVGLDPYRATQMDLGVEWYFDENAIASAAVFTKDIRSFLTSSVVIEKITDPSGTWDYEVTTPSQGRGGKLQGLELQYQQTFGNFGAIANYTYVDGEGENDKGVKAALPGTSRNSYNLTGYYETDLISARLAYTHRSEFLAEGLGIGGTELYADQSFLDANVTWFITDNINVSFDAQNLLGEVTTSTHGYGLETLSISNDNGTRYYVKASMKF
ncbi:TonB-dependent receptor [Cellvibrio sp. pealriver]|uniref:TonB-dependent receptor n=1 Tax=Cellvibrio sp. pealriver TaxID=1622269 RepID=UPI00066FDAD5|nr:TonB-dependent receptor [Cellvibrio sp. pealriver]